MAIFEYKAEGIAPDSQARLADINEYGLQTRAMLAALGDYWTAYYRDTGPIQAAMTGAMAAFSREYTHLLDMVRASNILDIPITDADQFELLLIDKNDFQPVYAEDGSIDHFFVAMPGLRNTEFLTTSLFESQVVLERGRHFEVIRDKGFQFYVDLFEDENITGYAYEIDNEHVRQILLWACDIALTSTVIYNRYGRFLYRKSADSEQYKWLVSALMLFYENAKSTRGIENVLNIMYGVPYTRYKDEVVTAIYYVDKNLEPLTETTEEPYICIETDKAKYYTYTFSTLNYSIGDVVPQFSLLSSFNKVEDYIDTPNWWENAAFADDLIAGASDLTVEQKNEIMDKVLKYNTVHINIGVSFDTYQTYLQQVEEFFKIIESGFPVYLYPVVDSIFKAVFIDKVDIEEEFRILKALLRLESYYDWGEYAKFDGKHHYYMEPEHDHGKEHLPQVTRFDGSGGYSLKDMLQGMYPDAPRFNGPHAYNTGWKLSHDHSNEYMIINKLGTRMEDNYPWGTSELLQHYTAQKYNNVLLADGSHTFGYGMEMLDSERLDIRVQLEPFADTYPEITDDASTNVTLVLSMNESPASEDDFRFSGNKTYSGFIAVAEKYLSEDFSISVHRRG